MTRTIDAHLTLAGPGVEISVQITEADLDDLTLDQRLAAELIAAICDTAAPHLEFATVTGAGKALQAADGAGFTTAGECSGSPATHDLDLVPEPRYDDPEPEPTPPAPVPTAPAGQPWPNAKTGRAKPKGVRRDSAQSRLLDLLADGPVSGTYEEIAGDIDCSYGALRQLLTKAVAKGTITRDRNGRTITLRLPGDTADPLDLAATP